MLKAYIKRFSNIGMHDVPSVGGKNASLGEMFSKLLIQNIRVPDGFATTALAFSEFLQYNNRLDKQLDALLTTLERPGYSNLAVIGAQARAMILKSVLPLRIELDILDAYRELCGDKELDVAVRSSATAEDLPQASFAGQHESFLNIAGEQALLDAVLHCYASLYTDRAIKYREDNGFKHNEVFLSVGVQLMVDAGKGASGVVFTLEPESGFRDVIHISGVWGLGEGLVQGTISPDECLVFKPALKWKKNAIIQKRLGEKASMLIHGGQKKAPVIMVDTPVGKRSQFVLNDEELLKLARWSVIIEEHYQLPMDIEWAKDGVTGELFILQARPETVHTRRNPSLLKQYSLAQRGAVLSSGEAVGTSIASGVARVLSSVKEAAGLNEGEIVVTDLTSPDWDPILKKAGAIVTNRGGRTSHASIVAREIGVPAIVGCGDATKQIKNGEVITVSCAEGKTGFVYQGKMPFHEETIDLSRIIKPGHTKAMLIIADPERAFDLSFYPADGVGLLRMEFIITHTVRVHPMALVRFSDIVEEPVRKQIEDITMGYANKEAYFIDKLSQGIATIAAAFYPKDVILRTSDFKTNEYASLIGGMSFEPHEENPMLGLRGASRYYNDLYREGFRLECEAIKKVRDEMGLTNVKVMIPFCRTVEEGNRVLSLMIKYGLEQGVNGLQVYVMAEIPSNIILAERFAKLFDGFSIGSNDLTQLTLGLDRDSVTVSNLFDEQNEAVRVFIAELIAKGHAAGIPTGLCGQAPSDSPTFAKFLVEQNIDNISFTPDALLKGVRQIVDAEALIGPSTPKAAVT